MDALPFGSQRLVRHLGAGGCDVEEISLAPALQKLGMTQEQFVDLCILLGCDYCGKIRGLGPKKALKLLQQHGSIEALLEHIDPKKHPLPESWPLEEVRRLFLHPAVAKPSQAVLEWREPDQEGLVRFLAHEKRMSEVRVRRRMERWQETRLKAEAPALPRAPMGGRKKTLKEFFAVKKHQQ
uniref:XPG-I domain-containing protein n=1 Tax=Sphenodon punctatus TaxID=8508 RepID=A0A8D0HRK4_SPHPU